MAGIAESFNAGVTGASGQGGGPPPAPVQPGGAVPPSPPSPAPQPTPAPTPAPQPQPAPVPQNTPQPANPTPAVPQDTPPTPEEAATIRAWLGQNGYGDLAGQYQDDRQLVADLINHQTQLLQQHQHLEQQMRLAQQAMAARMQQPQQGVQGQQGPPPGSTPAEQQAWWQKYWKPPEFNRAWLDQLHLDAEGNPTPRTPADLYNKYVSWRSFQQEQVNRFFDNPLTFMENPVRDLVQEEINRAVEQRLGNFQQVNYARDFIRQNSEWLHARDQSGQIMHQQVFDAQSGTFRPQPVLTPAGERFQHYVSQLDQAGVHDPATQAELALRQVRADIAMAQQQQLMQQQQAAQVPGQLPGQPAPVPPQPQTPEQLNQQTKENFLREQAGNRRGSQVNGTMTPPPAEANAGLTLRERLMNAFGQAGLLK